MTISLGRNPVVRHSHEVPEKLKKLAVLIRRHDHQCWEIGDVVADLVGRHRLTLGIIAKRVGYSRARLSEFHLTARTFTADERSEGSFYDGLMARRIWMRLPRLGMTPLSIRAEIIKLCGKRPRQILAHFVAILLKGEQHRSLATGAELDRHASQLINRPHCGDWRMVVPRLPDASVKVFICDPPFGGYSWREDGGYLSSRADTSGLRTDSDNNSDEEAVAVTLPLFAACLPKLAPGGCMVLFQAGGKPDRLEVLAEAGSRGWSCLYGLTWLKGTCTPSDCAYPYAPSSERILVFVRAGDRLEWHEPGLSRSDVLSFPSATTGVTSRMMRGKMPLKAVHMFQKPSALCEFLIRKHSHKGDLIVEPFGCSGVFSITAAQLGRSWMYIESNAENFRWGQQRIHEAIARGSLMAG